MIIWITGLSGAGKTTLAEEVVKVLRSENLPCVHLDGDALREVMQDCGLGYDRKSRIKLAYRYSRLAQLLESQRVLVVVSTMSLFHEIHRWNREHFANYLEVLVNVDIEILKHRDGKGIYKQASEGQLRHVGGVDMKVELPQSPDLILDNSGLRENLETLAAEIVHASKTSAALINTSPA